MPPNRENIVAHEWIGLRVSITRSSDSNLKGLVGIVRDETKNTFIIEVPGKRVTVPKGESEFLVELPTSQSVTIDGHLLQFRPEDRVKKGLSRW